MSIASDIIRGHIDTIILCRLMTEDSYGYEINKNIQKITNNQYEIKDATLYSAFRRLEQESLIVSYWGDEAHNARRKYYSITNKGKLAFKKNKSDWEEAKKIISILLECE